MEIKPEAIGVDQLETSLEQTVGAERREVAPTRRRAVPLGLADAVAHGKPELVEHPLEDRKHADGVRLGEILGPDGNEGLVAEHERTGEVERVGGIVEEGVEVGVGSADASKGGPARRPIRESRGHGTGGR